LSSLLSSSGSFFLERGYSRYRSKKSLDSFEWWAHKLILAVIKIVAKKKTYNLDGLERFLEDKYKTQITS